MEKFRKKKTEDVENTLVVASSGNKSRNFHRKSGEKTSIGHTSGSFSFRCHFYEDFGHTRNDCPKNQHNVLLYFRNSEARRVNMYIKLWD